MRNYHSYINQTIGYLSKDQICAQAEIRGSFLSPGVNGATVFYRHARESGFFIVSVIFGLPDNGIKSYEMCIHGGLCPAFSTDESTRHIARLKDPVLLPDVCGNGGFAFSVFYTEGLCFEDFMGRNVSILTKSTDRKGYYHRSDEQLGCGLILPVN